MWIRDKSRRVAGCLLAAAVAAIPVVVSTIELGSPSAGAPSRHVVHDEVSGVTVGAADWAFAPVCYGEFWIGRQTAAAWLAGWRYAHNAPSGGMRDGVAIVLAMAPQGGQFGASGGGAGGEGATGSVLGPVLASIVGGKSGGSGGRGQGRSRRARRRSRPADAACRDAASARGAGHRPRAGGPAFRRRRRRNGGAGLGRAGSRRPAPSSHRPRGARHRRRAAAQPCFKPARRGLTGA